MSKFATFDPVTSALTGRYDDAMHTSIPAAAVELDDATFFASMQPTSGQWTLINGVCTLVPLSAAAALASAQADQIAALAASYQAATHAAVTFTSAGGVAKSFQADPASVANLGKMLDAFAASKAVPAGFYWLSADNAQVPFTYADMQGLAQAFGLAGLSAFQNYQSKKAAVLAATTIATVQAVVF